jgi:CelD/BcsL family acetyltransferase involved in cellulose biosynthesis
MAFCANPLGRIDEVIFFSERKWAGLFKEMEIVGPVDPNAELLLKLRTKYRPDLIKLSLQSASNFPEKIDSWRLVEVRRINEDYSIPLGATPEEYLQRLGKQTRKHLPYYLRRLQRECQESFVIQTAIGEQISKQFFIDLLELNQLRMRSKGRETLWTRETAVHRWPLIQKTGLLVGLQLGGKLAGGTLSFLYGNEAFLVTIAHDPQYDRWNLGNICLWQTIEHLIRLGCRAFHLLWGTSFYKAQFGGQLAPIYRAMYARNERVATACRLWDLLKIEEVTALSQKISRRVRGYGVSVQDYLSDEMRGS